MNIDELIKIKALLKNVKIHIVPYCHADYAWTHPRKWHIERYEQIIGEVLDVLNTNSDYLWMADNVYPLLQPCLLDEFERAGEFWERVREGRIEITNGIMTLIRPTMTGDETFIRNIVLGKEFLASIIPDFYTDIFHNVDVSIGHSQLPQILVLGGYNFYRGWRPQGAMDKKGIPRQFYWEGIDGTSIICSRGTYAGFWQADYMDKENFSAHDGSLNAFYNTELKDILEHSASNHIWVPFGMDDTRPMRDVNDKFINLDEFMKYFKKETGASVFYSNAANYFACLSTSELPVYRGILDPSDVGYNISSKGDKGLWHFRLLLDRLLVTCESLWTMAVLEGGIYPEKEIEALWNNLLLICSHGMEFVFANDYIEIYRMAEFSVLTANTLIEEAKNVLSGCKPITDGHRYILLNTLNWDRNDIISLPLEINQNIESFEVKDSFGNTLNHQLVFSAPALSNHPPAILAEVLIPTMGFSFAGLNMTDTIGSLVITPPENNSQEPVEIDTGSTRVTFLRGTIKSVNGILKVAGNDFYLGKICFTELNQTPNDAWLYNNSRSTTSEMLPVSWSFEEFGPLRWKYVVTGTVGKYGFNQEITLYKNKSDIDFNLRLDCSVKGSGFFAAAFPADVNTEFIADIPFGIEKRDIINEPYGVVTDIGIDNLERLWDGVFYAKSWINYSIDNTNITLFGTDCPRYYWYDSKEKRVSFILNRNYILDACTDWMKDTHPWNESPGVISFSYTARIGSEPRDGSFLQIIKNAKEKQNPIEVMQGGIDPKTSKNIMPQSYFDIKAERSVISALYSKGDKTIMRMYNASGAADQVDISCCKRILSYMITDLLLNELPEKRPFLIKTENSISYNAAPWEIFTVVLELLM